MLSIGSRRCTMAPYRSEGPFFIEREGAGVKPSKSHRRKPTKSELARFKVMADLGLTPNAIGKQVGRDPKTIRSYLQSAVYEADSDLKEMVERIKTRELDDLYLLGQKARWRLHELVGTEKKMIPLIALQDRCFQQRRLLEGGSTANIGILSKIVVEADQNLFKPNEKPKIPTPASS